MPLNMKTMLLTGGAGDIGREIARQALAAGARVIVWDKNIDALTKSDLGGKVTATRMDVTDEAEVAKGFEALEQAGTLPDIIVNGAGVFTHLKPLGVLDFAGFQAVMQNNVNACFIMSSEGLRRYKDKLTIVNISSALSKRPIPTAAAYCASKAAIDSLTRSIAVEYAAKGVRANAVNPGPVEGELLQGGMAEIAAVMQAPPEAILGKIIEGLPQGRVVTPKEVAETVIFLAGDQSASINGQTINICGGYAF